MLSASLGGRGLDAKMIEGNLEVKLPTIWTDEKQRWEESETRREEKRRRREGEEKRREEERRKKKEERRKKTKKRKSPKKENPGARKGRKVAKHCVSPWFVAPEGRKVG